ncbi:hypothetical protein TNCV_5106001 [Trichonephila clavipes]|nr:hypothetical protein TNCV_5106001 [Trichonephila clavipes]
MDAMRLSFFTQKSFDYYCGIGCGVVIQLNLSTKARSLRAQAQLIQCETKTLTIEKKAERKTEVREQALPSSHHGNIIVE